MDGRYVGVGDVYVQDELGVEDWEIELEGGEVNGYELEGWVFGFGSD